MTENLLAATEKLSKCCHRHRFTQPVDHVYHPLQYARQAHQNYLQRFAQGRKHALFIGMNPGPWGMGQTGIPFGDVVSVREYLGISEGVTPPKNMHPKRVIQGFSCPRREVSGSRLWALFKSRYGSAEDFFSRYFVINYCPLLFINERGGNVTPDRLSASEIAPVYRCCDRFLQTAVEVMKPQLLVGIGGFAEKRLQALFAQEQNITIGGILHPSPASPAANRGFAETAGRQLQALGL